MAEAVMAEWNIGFWLWIPSWETAGGGRAVAVLLPQQCLWHHKGHTPFLMWIPEPRSVPHSEPFPGMAMAHLHPLTLPTIIRSLQSQSKTLQKLWRDRISLQCHQFNLFLHKPISRDLEDTLGLKIPGVHLSQLHFASQSLFQSKISPKPNAKSRYLPWTPTPWSLQQSPSFFWSIHDHPRVTGQVCDTMALSHQNRGNVTLYWFPALKTQIPGTANPKTSCGWVITPISVQQRVLETSRERFWVFCPQS